MMAGFSNLQEIVFSLKEFYIPAPSAERERGVPAFWVFFCHLGLEVEISPAHSRPELLKDQPIDARREQPIVQSQHS